MRGKLKGKEITAKSEAESKYFKEFQKFVTKQIKQIKKKGS